MYADYLDGGKHFMDDGAEFKSAGKAKEETHDGCMAVLLIPVCMFYICRGRLSDVITDMGNDTWKLLEQGDISVLARAFGVRA